MKNITGIVLFILFVGFGIGVGIHLNSGFQGDVGLSYGNDVGVQEVNDLKKANQDMKNRIKDLKEQVEEYEKEQVQGSIPLKKLKSEVDQYKLLAGHVPVVGPGIVITLDGPIEENIGGIIHQRRYLVNLINELRVFGGEVVALNQHRITARTEVEMAGSHINVNGQPIAPPYVIEVIGNTNALSRYTQYRTILLEMMESDGIQTSVRVEENISIGPIHKEKPIQFLKPIEE